MKVSPDFLRDSTFVPVRMGIWKWSTVASKYFTKTGPVGVLGPAEIGERGFWIDGVEIGEIERI